MEEWENGTAVTSRGGGVEAASWELRGKSQERNGDLESDAALRELHGKTLQLCTSLGNARQNWEMRGKTGKCQNTKPVLRFLFGNKGIALPIWELAL